MRRWTKRLIALDVLIVIAFITFIAIMGSRATALELKVIDQQKLIMCLQDDVALLAAELRQCGQAVVWNEEGEISLMGDQDA